MHQTALAQTYTRGIALNHGCCSPLLFFDGTSVNGPAPGSILVSSPPLTRRHLGHDSMLAVSCSYIMIALIKIMLADLIHCQKKPPVRPVRSGAVTKNVTLRIVVASLWAIRRARMLLLVGNQRQKQPEDFIRGARHPIRMLPTMTMYVSGSIAP